MTHDPRAAQEDARRKLDMGGTPNAAVDAAALIKIVQGDAPPWAALTDAQLAELDRLVDRRLRREPISHIAGKRAFWMHEFIVTPDVLDPRPDTETLVEVALTRPFDTVLDLGTGSGCIVLSLLHERPAARGQGADISAAALDVARRNADLVGVADRITWTRSDWFSEVHGPFDLIVSNPPYIARSELPSLAPELGFEPRIALTDEADGLTAYRILTRQSPRHLRSGGRLVVEIGLTQAEEVAGLFDASGFSDVTVHTDLDGRNRVVSGVLLPQSDGN